MLAPLTLELEFARAEQAGDPYAFRCTPQEYRLRSGGGGVESAQLPWDASLLADLDAARRPGRDPVILARLGETLRQFLTPLGWAEQSQRILSAAQSGRRVLVSIRSAAAELYALPWELLTIKATGQHLGELPNVLIRYEWPETATTPEQPIPRHGGGRILLAWSAAGGAVPASEQELAIGRACAAGALPFDPSRDVLGHASLGRLGAVLAAAKKDDSPISILHILCHGAAAGNTFGLALNGETPGAESVVVDAGRLRQLLAPYAGMVRLIVLMACDSGNTGTLGNQLGSVAQALHRAGFMAVIASRHPLSMSGAKRLTESLYPGLLIGPDSLESGLLSAREELARDAAQIDWASVQLYARATDGEDTRPVVFRPYAGLAAFGIEQRRFYFGREALTEKIWSRSKELFTTPGSTRLLALLGPSGSGKSSVARAGLLAEVTKRSLSDRAPTRVAVLKPGAHPLRALASALAVLPMQHPDAPVLVLVDQLEEIYTLCADPAERDAFVDLLLRGARAPDLAVMIVLTLRSDFIGETQRRHPELNRLFDEQARIVTAMSEDQLRRAVAQPAAQAGRPIDEATIELLLSEAQGSDGALPLLEFALARIWEGMLAGKDPGGTLRELGGVGGALAGEAKKLYGSLSPAEQSIARRALVRLVKLGEGTRDTRRRAPIHELCGRGETEEDVLRVLRRFASEHSRMVTLSSEGTDAVAEVTHEALFEHWAELRSWIDEGRADRRFHDRAQDAAALWEADRRDTGRLWRAPDLDLLRKYRERKPEELSPLQEAFFLASERKRRRDRVIRGLSIGAVLLAAVGTAAFYARTSEQIRQQLLSREVEQGRKLLFEQDNPTEALLWLNRAHRAGASDPILPDLLKSATQGMDATHTVLIGSEETPPTPSEGRGTSSVLSASYSPDGRRVLVRNRALTARIWDVETRQFLMELKGHQAVLQDATYSPDGRRILTAGGDGTARIWDAVTGNKIAELKTPLEVVRSASYSADGRRIVTVARVSGRRSSTNDRAAQIWDAETGHLITQLMDSNAIGAELSPDGRRVVTWTGASVTVWDAETGQLITGLSGPTGTSFHSTYSPDGRRILTTRSDNIALVWDAETGQLLQTLRGHDGAVLSGSFSADGRRILTTSEDKTAQIWEVETGQHRVLLGHRGSVFHAALSPDGLRIVTASEDRTIRVWESESGRLLEELAGHTGTVRRAAFSPDGHRILSSSDDKTARIWKSETGRMLAELKGAPHELWSAVYSPDGRRILTAPRGSAAEIWESESGKRLAELKSPGMEGVFRAAYSSDGRHIVTTHESGTARIWESESGRMLRELSGPHGIVWSAAFRPDGLRIVTTSQRTGAQIWDLETGQMLRELRTDSDARSARYSPDGRFLLTASNEGLAQIWDPESGQMLLALKGHDQAIWSVAYSPDGLRIVTASADHTVRVWEAKTGRILAVLKGHTGSVYSAAYRPDGRRIVTTSEDQTVRIWEAETGEPELGKPETRRLLAESRSHGATVYSAEYSPDGLRLITAGGGHTARVWDVSPERRTSSQIARLIRCYALARFEGDVVVPATPQPEECAGER